MMRLDKSLITLFAGLAQLPEDDTDASLAWLVKAVTQWSAHISDHAIDFVDASARSTDGPDGAQLGAVCGLPR